MLLREYQTVAKREFCDSSLATQKMPRTPESFVRARRESWSRLHDLVDKAQKARLAALSDDELHELGTLYRRASADLARAQTRYGTTTAGLELVRSLNALVLRAHSQIYSAPPPAPSRGFWFFFYGFPEAFRRHWKLIALAAFLMFAPALASYVAVWSNADTAKLLVPDQAVRVVESVRLPKAPKQRSPKARRQKANHRLGRQHQFRGSGFISRDQFLHHDQ